MSTVVFKSKKNVVVKTAAVFLPDTNLNVINNNCFSLYSFSFCSADWNNDVEWSINKTCHQSKQKTITETETETKPV